MDEETLKKLFGNRIRALRKSARLTQEQLAELVGLDTQHLCKMENGIHFPKVKNLVAIAEVFQVDISDLFIFEKPNDKKNNLVYTLALTLKKLSEYELEIVSKFISALFELRKK